MSRIFSISLSFIFFFFASLLPLAAQNANNAQSKLLQLQESYIDLVCSTDQYPELVAKMGALPREKENSDFNIIEIFQRLYPLHEDYIADIIQSMDEHGAWPDIDYKASNLSGWKAKVHQERLLDLIKYHHRMQQEQTPSFTKAQLEEAIHLAMQCWFNKKLVSPNWWQNCIGTPKVLGQAFIIFRPYMNAEELSQARELMSKKVNLWFEPTGQNKIWMCEAQLLRALFLDDYEGIQAMRDAFLLEICTGKNEGIQTDWTFHQHGAQQQMGNYGLAYLMSMSFYSNLFAGTELAFPAEKQAILNQLCLEGYQWMVWGDILDVNALNRHLNHNGCIHRGIATRYAAHLLQKNSIAADKKRLQDYLQHKPVLGQKFFAESELCIHRTKDWMLSLRMASQRLIGCEKCNGDGRNSSFMADGGMYIYQSPMGEEYENIFPLWNPRRIPGITCMESEESPFDLVARNGSKFSLGVTDGQSGITSLELNRYGVHAFKSWIVTNEWILCLGSDIHADKPGVLTTSLAERLSKGELFYWLGDKWTTITEKQVLKNTQDQRFYSDGIAYIIPKAKELVADNRTVSGDWHNVCTFYTSPTVEEQQLLSLYQRHSDGESSYLYYIIPATNKKKAATFDTSQVQVLYQNKDIHAVLADGVYYLSVRKLGEYNFPFSAEIKLNKPGNYMIKKTDQGWECLQSQY